MVHILIAFALSVLVWWLLTDDDAPAPAEEVLPEEASLRRPLATTATAGPPTAVKRVLRWAWRGVQQVYGRAKTWATTARTGLLASIARARR